LFHIILKGLSDIPEICILRIYFKNKFRTEEIPLFRGAISTIAGKEHILFHQHIDEGYRYSYPLIQYKVIGGKTMMLCIGNGMEEVKYFFRNNHRQVKAGNRMQKIEVSSMRQNWYRMKTHSIVETYRMHRWVALNQDNYRKYINIRSLKSKIQFLESILTGNILSFAKGIGWTIGDEIKMNILEITELHPIHIKKMNMMAFNVVFETNVFLPNYIGLGKFSSIGYGIVKRKVNPENI